MKVCLISISNGRSGGQASAYRLYQGLQERVDSTMLVGRESRGDHTVVSPKNKLAQAWFDIAPRLDAVPKLFYPNRDRITYNLQWLPDRIAARISQIAPDIINLHWVNSGYLKIETVAKFNKPIVWTLHDSWAFTGGCHIPYDCLKYTDSCGACPQLQSNRDWDLSRWVWQRKAKAWKNLNLTIVTPSNWLAKCAKASSLFRDLRIEVIPNGLDLTKYKPIEQISARKVLNLPQDKQLVLFGAMDATSNLNKGFHLLQPALQSLSQSQWRQKLEIVIFGASEPQNPPDLGFKCNYLGRLNDDISLVLAYSAADVMVVPSIQDNLPNTVMEALACGTPTVAFNIGGMPDLIDHQQNGYLATPYEPEDLARGISWVIEDRERWQNLSICANTKADREYTIEKQAQTYIQLYEDILYRS